MSTTTADLHRAPIEAVDQRSSAVGLRAVASFEALKGTVVLVLGIILLAVHKHAWDLTESLLFHLHINLDRRLGSMLMNAATKLSDARLLTIAAAIVTYCTVRFVEAWGLWNRRVWAEWFALLSGAMYLPWELLKIVERADWERIGVLAVNVIIVLYMLEIRIRECGSLLKCENPVKKPV
ncbi:MAG: DUF2127 domain-containing protein [Acidobacteriaceae bacterium]|nr:DUF2127 domain-containing protein [Acidobacteriaceae bacterium]MBV9296062.1 DUF2127 domain-containing protein [Acidobacteriaceae bacterium]MBV9767392.1 DUF2127 domain-containing protein [Acidobacteriaceae bacterium]